MTSNFAPFPISSRVSATLASLLFAVALACTSCEGLGGPGVDLERMIDQAKLEVYEASPYFPDGRGMQHPPKGTVPRERLGQPEYAFHENGEYVQSIPIPLTRELLMRGQERFDIFCATCHGVLGTGISQVAENMALAKPASLVSGKVSSYPPGRIYAVIEYGYGLMPAYAGALPETDRWAVVAYVQALRLSQNLAFEALPASMQSEMRVQSRRGAKSAPSGAKGGARP